MLKVDVLFVNKRLGKRKMESKGNHLYLNIHPMLSMLKIFMIAPYEASWGHIWEYQAIQGSKK